VILKRKLVNNQIACIRYIKIMPSWKGL